MDSSVKGKGEIIFQIIVNVVMILLMLLAVLPFLLLVMSSVTDEKVLLVDGYSFFPRVFSGYAYEYLFVSNAENIFRAYGITFFVTIVGTIIALIVAPDACISAFKKRLSKKKDHDILCILTMLFNGGLVPSYIMWTQIFHVKNTIFALLFPTLLMNGFYIMILRSNFKSNIHPALIEAAKIDGAGELLIYRKIVLPLSLPIMATIGLMIGIGYWNDWMNGLYYITDNHLYSLQQLLNNILQNIKALASMSSSVTVTQEMPSTGIRMAMAVIGVVPIMVLYPFFQKYFVKGIAIGGVKE